MLSAFAFWAKHLLPWRLQAWEFRLNSFIEMFEYGLLEDNGKEQSKTGVN